MIPEDWPFFAHSADVLCSLLRAGQTGDDRQKGGRTQSSGPYPPGNWALTCTLLFGHSFIRSLLFNDYSLSVSHGLGPLLGIWVNSEQNKDSCPCGVTVQLGGDG